jgi:hypothetical protein
MLSDSNVIFSTTQAVSYGVPANEGTPTISSPFRNPCFDQIHLSNMTWDDKLLLLKAEAAALHGNSNRAIS